MKVEGNKVIAKEGKILLWNADNSILGIEVYCGKNFWYNGKYISEGIDMTPDDIIEMSYVDIDGKVYTINNDNSYDILVSELIHHKYSIDAEISLLNNYYLNGENNEFKEYQSWRAKCKEAAKQYLNKNEEVK